jgi:dipeptidyl aminopeptidase/acylaminoacyl peptidase
VSTPSHPAPDRFPPLIPRELLFGNPEKSSPRISPDGRRLAYLAPDDRGVLNVWVRALGQQDDRVATADKKRGIRMFLWQGDSEHLLYLQDQEGDENFHLYQTDLATRNTRDLTPWQGVRAQLVASDLNYPDHLLVALNLRDRRLFDVYRLDVRAGALALDTENPGDVAAWTADNTLQVRAAQVILPDGGQEIRLREAVTAPWRTFQRWGPEESGGGVAGFAPDNRQMYLISSVEANAARLLEMGPAGGPARVIAEDPQYDISSVMTHPRTHQLEAVAFLRSRREWQVIDPTLEADFAALRQLRDGDFAVVSRDREDQTWIVSFVVDNGPVSYYAYERGTRRATLLFTDRPALAQYPLARMEPITYTARDGLTIHGYLTLPLGIEPQGLPAVLLVHGGPWGRDVWGLDPWAQWLANRGYAVLQVNFRGSAGYGKAFLNAGDREWAGKMHDDLIDAKRWLVSQGRADPEQVAIMGGSYGGYAALVGLTFTPEAFACGVDIVGPSHLVTLLKNPPPYWAPTMPFIFRRVGNPETEVEFLESRSPLPRADQIVRPLLILQGANDPRVKQQESDQIVAAMRQKGQPVEYIVFPDEGHGFARPENNLKCMAAIEPFLAQYLGGRAEPPSEKEAVHDLRR